MNHKQKRLLKDIASQLREMHKMTDYADDADGKIDGDVIMLRSLIALSALRSFYEEETLDDFEAVNKANNIDIAEAMAQ